MSKKPSPSEEADRLLRLLWRHTLGEPAGARGPRQGITVDEVVRASIALADREGLAAVSMRKLAEALGVGVMTLYTYVPGKDDLVALMVDEVEGEVEPPGPSGGLRDRLAAMAESLWDEYRRHPWLLDVGDLRFAPGPNGSERFEWQLALIEGLGLDDIEMDQTVAAITGFTASCARAALQMQRIQERSGMSDARWWEINAPILAEVMPADRYPIAERVGTTAGTTYNAASDPGRTFRFGLERILDGLEGLVSSRSGS
ncbi:TetR/AcrR family transcriptional regulator [Rhodococcus triatomae]|uniref:Regulatory protein, tetR family n=1 Tax=Rhodococcus triatomae TaxID=300028 RepID=A0A1G8BB76_9NOCA|nr:TetR/AcrR family transcriptional regulator [Rhodococcus triatomae]QNG17470.1 TetR/AcrR family transcriptional regulator [Rhodococcus triatomae]QNG22862.1 TetR/AcrR family transcriptional regulator [Rhodococcus triatomae]SDH30479.1 regulatory protein, tetR family [Rhodococcus triatomae]